jgi:hypothetical protein
MLHEAFGLSKATAETAVRAPFLSLRGGVIATDDEQQGDEESDDESDSKIDGKIDGKIDSKSGRQHERPQSQPTHQQQPVTVVVNTALGHAILDHSIELANVVRTRNIASLKESLRRQLPGRPPVHAMQLVWAGRVVADDVLVNQLMEEETDYEQDDDDMDDNDESSSNLQLQLDMIPPVDPKFVPLLEQKITDMTTAALLDAYAANEAAMYQNAILLITTSDEDETNDIENDINDDDDEKSTLLASGKTTTPAMLVSTAIREQAARIRKDLHDRLLITEQARHLLEVPTEDEQQQHQQQEDKLVSVLPTTTTRRGDRVRPNTASSVRVTLKRKIQHNLNIDWADSARMFLLFLFFGWFGGRTPLARAILLLGAPSVFVLQARPVKLWTKQLLYAVLNDPPSIFLSLLPAPQQMILSMDVAAAMKTMYGHYLVPSDSTADKEAELQEGNGGEVEYELGFPQDDEYEESEEESDEE